MTQFIKNMSEICLVCLRTLLGLRFKKIFIYDFSSSKINFRFKLNALALASIETTASTGTFLDSTMTDECAITNDIGIVIGKTAEL